MFDIKIVYISGTPLGSVFLAPKRLRSLNGRKILESISFFVLKFYTFLAPLSDPNREEIHAMLCRALPYIAYPLGVIALLGIRFCEWRTYLRHGKGWEGGV